MYDNGKKKALPLETFSISSHLKKTDFTGVICFKIHLFRENVEFYILFFKYNIIKKKCYQTKYSYLTA